MMIIQHQKIFSLQWMKVEEKFLKDQQDKKKQTKNNKYKNKSCLSSDNFTPSNQIIYYINIQNCSFRLNVNQTQS